MPDETGTEATRSDAPGVDYSLFGDAADEKPAAVAEEQGSTEETEQDGQGPGDTGETEAEETPEDEQGSEVGEGTADTGADAPANELKVVVSIKGVRATIGVQRPSADPHIESFDDLDESGLAVEVPAVVERARARWEESPRHPAYERPAPPARRRNRRQQGSDQAANTGTEAEQTQQQTLRLF